MVCSCSRDGKSCQTGVSQERAGIEHKNRITVAVNRLETTCPVVMSVQYHVETGYLINYLADHILRDSVLIPAAVIT